MQEPKFKLGDKVFLDMRGHTILKELWAATIIEGENGKYKAHLDFHLVEIPENLISYREE